MLATYKHIRWWLRYIWLLIGSLVFVAEGVFLVTRGSWFGWAGILFFGLGMVVAGVSLLPGSAYLRLDAAGFTMCALFKPHSYRWYEVDSFKVGRLGTRKSVVFDYSRLHRGKESLRKFNSRTFGFQGSLPDTYGMSAEKLAATLNEWRQRYAQSSEA
jgi:hypothetical protein